MPAVKDLLLTQPGVEGSGAGDGLRRPLPGPVVGADRLLARNASWVNQLCSAISRSPSASISFCAQSAAALLRAPARPRTSPRAGAHCAAAEKEACRSPAGRPATWSTCWPTLTIGSLAHWSRVRGPAEHQGHRVGALPLPLDAGHLEHGVARHRVERHHSAVVLDRQRAQGVGGGGVGKGRRLRGCTHQGCEPEQPHQPERGARSGGVGAPRRGLARPLSRGPARRAAGAPARPRCERRPGAERCASRAPRSCRRSAGSSR